MLVYEAFNYSVIEKIPVSSKMLLDVGCGSGEMGKYLKSKNEELIVCGLTYSEEEAKLATNNLDEVRIVDLNNMEFRPSDNFDCVVCSHVLEHLYDPTTFLLKVKQTLVSEGVLIVALPNILYWKQRWSFFTGNFDYTNGGLMDKTHFRFFSYKTSLELIYQSNLKVAQVRAQGNFPLPGIRSILPSSISKSIDNWACKQFPGLFGAQFIIVCHR